MTVLLGACAVVAAIGITKSVITVATDGYGRVPTIKQF